MTQSHIWFLPFSSNMFSFGRESYSNCCSGPINKTTSPSTSILPYAPSSHLLELLPSFWFSLSLSHSVQLLSSLVYLVFWDFPNSIFSPLFLCTYQGTRNRATIHGCQQVCNHAAQKHQQDYPYFSLCNAWMGSDRSPPPKFSIFLFDHQVRWLLWP